MPQEVYLYLNKSSGAILNNLCEPLFTIYDASQSEEDIANNPVAFSIPAGEHSCTTLGIQINAKKLLREDPHYANVVL